MRWEHIDKCNLIVGRYYKVIDRGKYIWKSQWDGDCFKSGQYVIKVIAVLV